MTVYSPRINARFRSPSHTGAAGGANATGTTASFECGSFVRVSLSIDKDSKVIRKGGFQTNGCGYMVAAADLIAEYLTGRDLTQLHAVEETEFLELITSRLGKFPPERLQCGHLAIQALRQALADYRALLVEEFTGEKALICTCFGVSEESIEAFISANSPDSVEDVTAACRAGAGCGACRMLIQEMIDAQELLRRDQTQ